MRNLSELECVSLGVIYHNQPCTAYFVRRQLIQSPSSLWQASAGSVYPLVNRLEASGLLSSSTDGDKRGRKMLSVTKKGEQTVKAWVLAGADHAMVSSIMDPIRSRISFLRLLHVTEQKSYLDDLLGLMDNFYQQTQMQLSNSDPINDIYTYLVDLGAVQTTKARMQWLKEVRKLLINNP